MRGLKYVIPISLLLWLLIFAGGANAYTVTTTVMGNATTSPSSPQTIASGGALSIIITPTVGYQCTAYRVNNTWTDGIATEILLQNITSDTSVFIVVQKISTLAGLSESGNSKFTATTTGLKKIFQYNVIGTQTHAGVMRTNGASNYVYVDWGDGGPVTSIAGTTDQAYSKNYGSAGNRTVRIYAASEAVLTKWTMETAAANVGGVLSMPSGMTYFYCGGSNTLSGTLSLPSGMTTFACYGNNTLSGTLSFPSGMTFFHCGGSNTLSGTLSLPSVMTYFYCGGSNTLSGTLSLPSGMTYFACYGTNTLSGTLSLPSGMTTFIGEGYNRLSGTLSLPSGMTTFACTGYNTLSGTLSLPSGMTTFSCYGNNTLSGTLSIPSGMTYFACYGYNTLSGTLSLSSGITYFACYGNNTISDWSWPTIASNQTRFYFIPTGAGGFSAARVDALFNLLDTAGGTWASSKEIYIKGTNAAPTAASATARASLAAKGVTITTN